MSELGPSDGIRLLAAGQTPNPLDWSAEIDDILGGDLTAAVAYATPSGGAVATAIEPLGLRDRQAGTVAFTSTLGFAKKLDRIRAEPRVALAYHSRQYGFATSGRFVVVQGVATIDTAATQELVDHILDQILRFSGPLPRWVRFWDWWLREYGAIRVPVVVSVTRIVSWPTLDCDGPASVLGALLPDGHPASQPAPRKGTAPRVNTRRAGKRAARLPHQLLSFLDASGAPVIVPVHIDSTGQDGLRLRAVSGLLPPGHRRAGLLTHRYRPQLVGLATRYLTGWLQTLDDEHALYAPHTDRGFIAPPNKTAILLVNGGIAKVKVRRAIRRGTIGQLPTPFKHSGRGWRPQP